MDLKNSLQHVFDELKKLEERARKLKNQNLADIVTSARGKVQQLSEHPDLELLDDKKDQAPEGQAPFPGGPNPAGSAGQSTAGQPQSGSSPSQPQPGSTGL